MNHGYGTAQTQPRSFRWGVVGGNGFIGSSLIARLASYGIAAHAVSAPRVTMAEDTGARLAVRTSVDLGIEVRKLADELVGCDVVINAAGLAAPAGSSSAELYGANALLPAIVARAARVAGAGRFIHLSSAAVQGRRQVLDELPQTTPFSPYSRSKALGEEVLGLLQDDPDFAAMNLVILRATSVQGPDRATTASLRRVARSRLASTASPGNHPTVVSSIHGLTDFLVFIGEYNQDLPRILLQPWERSTTASVLRAAGAKSPFELPAWFCRSVVLTGYGVSRAISSRLTANVRRLELMWFGQKQNSAWAEKAGFTTRDYLNDILAPGSRTGPRSRPEIRDPAAERHGNPCVD